MSTAASKATLQELHSALAEALAKKIKEGTAVAADFNVIRQFLKDNDIQAVASKGSPLAKLTQAGVVLPFGGNPVLAKASEDTGT